MHKNLNNQFCLENYYVLMMIVVVRSKGLRKFSKEWKPNLFISNLLRLATRYNFQENFALALFLLWDVFLVILFC